eukprot:c4769_g1_i1.p1 GENE.c4769_g1_i1~~c4769_g1_i1.p1  ORF type:complete len:407 (+),score=54.76 c4769_g1_i1:393-1613(+)
MLTLDGVVTAKSCTGPSEHPMVTNSPVPPHFFKPTVPSSNVLKGDTVAHHWTIRLDRLKTCFSRDMDNENFTMPSSNSYSCEIIDDHFGVAPASQPPSITPANMRWHFEERNDTTVLLNCTGMAVLITQESAFTGQFTLSLPNGMLILLHPTGTYNCRGLFDKLDDPHTEPAHHNRSVPPFLRIHPAVAKAVKHSVDRRTFRDAARILFLGTRHFGAFSAKLLTHFVCEWDLSNRNFEDEFTPKGTHRSINVARKWGSSPELTVDYNSLNCNDTSNSNDPSKQKGRAAPDRCLLRLQHELWDRKGGLFLFGRGCVFVGSQSATLATSQFIQSLTREEGVRMVKEACLWKRRSKETSPIPHTVHLEPEVDETVEGKRVRWAELPAKPLRIKCDTDGGKRSRSKISTN